MSHSTFDLFAFSTSRPFGERIAAHLRVALAPHEERPLEDGEHKTRPLVSVRGHDVYAWIRDTDTRVGSVLQRFPITYRICKPRRFRLPFKRYILANKKTKQRVPPGTEAASSSNNRGIDRPRRCGFPLVKTAKDRRRMQHGRHRHAHAAGIERC